MTQAEYTKKRKSKKRKKIVLAVCIALLVVVLGGVGAAFAYINTINANLNEGVDDDLRDALVDTKYAGDPFYMLLMGTDGSEERSESAEYAGDQFRSDSMILARIDPQSKQVTMVSLHRDTLIDMGTNALQAEAQCGALDRRRGLHDRGRFEVRGRSHLALCRNRLRRLQGSGRRARRCGS